VIEFATLKQCPFCGADAQIKWTFCDAAAKRGEGEKALRVSCSREGECPSPSWEEVCSEHEDDAECLVSVVTFWNTRAEDWSADEMIKLRLRLVSAENRARIAEIERDRAQKACEQIAAQINTMEPSE